MLVKTVGLMASPEVIMTAVKAASFSTAGRAWLGRASPPLAPERGVEVPEAPLPSPGVSEPWASLVGTARLAAAAVVGLSSLFEFCCR